MYLACRQAIFRKGLGATLINDFQPDIRKQQFNIPSPPPAIDHMKWPVGNKLAASIPACINNQELDEMLQQHISDKHTTTRAVVVVHNGKLIAEQYAPGFSDSTVMPAWSVNKSITGCLIGILVKQGKINIDEPAIAPHGRHSKSINHHQTTNNFRWLILKIICSPAAINMLFRKAIWQIMQKAFLEIYPEPF